MMDAVPHGNFMIASNEVALIGDDTIKSRILTIRGVQVLLDRDLAMLYGVETKVLNQAVKRNIARFPDSFMFQLSREEMENWKSQFVTSNLSYEDEAGLKMGLRRPPFAFTEQGIAMLSAVLRSSTAIEVSIRIKEAGVCPLCFMSGCLTAYSGFFSDDDEKNIAEALSKELPGVKVSGNRGFAIGNKIGPTWNFGIRRTYVNGQEK